MCSLCIDQNPGLWPITAVLASGRKLRDGALQQLTGHEKRTSANQHVLQDAPSSDGVPKSSQPQIGPDHSATAVLPLLRRCDGSGGGGGGDGGDNFGCGFECVINSRFTS